MVERKHVYVYKIGASNCYKIGRTKHAPDQRMRGWATGSPVRPKLYKDLVTENPSVLETYIHRILEMNRRENGEFFSVSQDVLDQAIGRAEAFAKEFCRYSSEAKTLSRRKPSNQVAVATDEVRGLYDRLREAVQQKYLLDREIELLVSKVKVAIGESRAIDGIASWDWRTRSTMDIKRFQQEEPSLYEEYRRDSSCRVFRLYRIDLTEQG